MEYIDDTLLAAVLGRDESLFAGAVGEADKELKAAIKNKKILVIGAAGSIGAAFVKQLTAYGPSTLHLIDINENGLAEVVRDLRSSAIAVPNDFQTFSIGIGSPEFSAFLKAGFAYDAILNFAALKHVRAERDPWSMMRMLNTNVVYLDDLLHEASGHSRLERVFSVSSDKSVNPASAMGSSKTLMEEVLWMHSNHVISTSARFANVAFSSGSLLESFLTRLSKKQPLAAPTDVKRFFISHEEAGQLCLFGAFLTDTREVVFPSLSPQDDMLTFADIAVTVLAHYGYEARQCDTDEEAREMAAKLSLEGAKQWPVRFSSSDTSGEKMYEEFYSDADEVDTTRWSNIGVVRIAEFTAKRADELRTGLDIIRGQAHSGKVDKEEMLSVLKSLVAGMRHVDTGSNLDSKM